MATDAVPVAMWRPFDRSDESEHRRLSGKRAMGEITAADGVWFGGRSGARSIGCCVSCSRNCQLSASLGAAAAAGSVFGAGHNSSNDECSSDSSTFRGTEFGWMPLGPAADESRRS